MAIVEKGVAESDRLASSSSLSSELKYVSKRWDISRLSYAHSILHLSWTENYGTHPWLHLNLLKLQIMIDRKLQKKYSSDGDV